MEQVVPFNDTGIIAAISIFGQTGNVPVAKTSEEVKQYISLKSVQIKQNWDKNEFSNEEFDLVPCVTHTHNYDGAQLSKNTKD